MARISSAQSSAVTKAVLLTVRAARNARGLQCPHCQSRRLNRWGSFSMRQRYRCCDCKRTFSDLTGTPAAFTKLLAYWPSYCACMSAGTSLRRAARVDGIHVSTAFRWRHAMLAALEQADDTTLHGLVEIDRTGFLYSEKGSRNLKREPRRRGAWENRFRWNLLCVSASVACDRAAHVASTVSRFPYPRWDDLVNLTRRARTPTSVLGNFGPISDFALAARKAGHTYHHVPRFRFMPGLEPHFHVDTVWRYMARLRRWLVRFRGVATRYLQHYLAWHRWLEVPELRALAVSRQGTVAAHCAAAAGRRSPAKLSSSGAATLCSPSRARPRYHRPAR